MTMFVNVRSMVEFLKALLKIYAIFIPVHARFTGRICGVFHNSTKERVYIGDLPMVFIITGVGSSALSMIMSDFAPKRVAN